MISVGQLVYSKNGRDKGEIFIVSKIESGFVYLINGKRRTLNKPKKKKIKHVQIINYVDEGIQASIQGADVNLLDSHIRKAIKNYLSLSI